MCQYRWDGLALGIVVPAAAATPPTPKAHFNICTYAAEVFLTRSALTVKHAVWYHTHPGSLDVRGVNLLTSDDAPSHLSTNQPAISLKDFSWNVTFLGNGALSLRNYLQSWVLHGPACDALVAPGFSRLATAMSPLLDAAATAWVDPFATAAELSDKALHPAFSRMMPTSESTSAAFAGIALQFGWSGVNTMCVDDPYSRAVVRGFERAIVAANGTLHVSRCLSASVTEAIFAETMRTLEAESPSRVLLLHAVGATRTMMLRHLRRMAYDERFILLVPDICSSKPPGYVELKSALCVALSFDADLAQPFRDSYISRDVSEDNATLMEMPKWTGTILDLRSFADALPYAHDATVHAMRALALRHTVGGIAHATAVRSVRTSGITGRFQLDAVGDRPNAVRRLYNTRGGYDVVVGVVSPAGAVTFLNADGDPTEGAGKVPPPLALMGSLTSDIPSWARPARPSSKSNLVLYLAVGAAVVVALVVAAVVTAFLWGRSQAFGRDNSNAPKSSDEPFAIVFTDIQASTALWAHVPEQMSEAVDVHHGIIRSLIRDHGGYEVKTIGDSFMVAFADAQAAVSFSLDSQRRLFSAAWPCAINATYSESCSLAFRPHLWNGLRVRVGAHYGLGKIQQDPVTQGFDYYGTVVNTAARVEAVGHGGQTLVTSAVVEALHRSHGADLAGAIANDLGPQSLRGLEDTVRVYELLPSELSQRTFPPLRLDVEVDDAEREDLSLGLSGTPEDSSRTQGTGTPYMARSASANSDRRGFGFGDRLDAELLRLATIAANRRRAHRSTAVSASASASPAVLSPTEPLPVPRVSVPADGDLGALPGQPVAPAPATSPAVAHIARDAAVDPSHSAEMASMFGAGVGRDLDRDHLLLLAVFLRRLLSAVPAKERHRSVALYARRWHTNIATPGQVRNGHPADGLSAADLAGASTVMALVERVWSTLHVNR